MPGLARDLGQHEIGHTSVFATFPLTGRPFGIAVDNDKIHVDTSRGDFFASQTNSTGERLGLFVSDMNGVSCSEAGASASTALAP